MLVVDGNWIMFGVDPDDPSCLHSPKELVAFVNKSGFLPLFSNKIKGFSVEEMTVPENWWNGDPAADPWAWREEIAGSGKLIYGKFFARKAGYISKKWFPLFANARRDGYDFDALWDDGKAKNKEKKIMDLFESSDELFSYEIKDKAGFGKNGEKNFDGSLTDLQMKTYLAVSDFKQRTNSKGESYGWAVARYSCPETIMGRDKVRSSYPEDPEESSRKIIEHVMKLYDTDEKTVRKVLGGML